MFVCAPGNAADFLAVDLDSLIIHQNYAWALGYNGVALPVAAIGLLTPWLAALGMSLSSLLVVVNALRLARAGARGARRDP